jgi:hypothetical protein
LFREWERGRKKSFELLVAQFRIGREEGGGCWGWKGRWIFEGTAHSHLALKRRNIAD